MDNPLKLILEALLLTSHEPLSIQNMLTAFDEIERPTEKDLTVALTSLAQDYQDRAMNLVCIKNKYAIQTKAIYSPWISRMHAEKPPKYSKALLETLAIIAYKQPVTRADIEEVRGVAVNPLHMRALLERDWIKQAGVRDVPGRPAIYVTTDDFLRYFNLESLDKMPELSEPRP